MAFVMLDNTTDLVDVLLNQYKEYKSIIFSKSVQSGKTSDIIALVNVTYKESATIFISDKNTALTSQTNSRVRTCGWTVENFRDASKTGNAYNCISTIKDSMGKKKLFHTMMEINNLRVLYAVLSIIDCPVTLIIDEADKNRNVSEFDADDEDSLPIITKLLLKIKNTLLAKEDGSRVIFVSATPQSLLVSEKDEKRLVIYKKPYNNYIGAGLDHTPNLEVIVGVRDNPITSTKRWTNSQEDCRSNTYRPAINSAIDRFLDMQSKDTSVKQLMLVSLESRNRNQQEVAKYIKSITTPDDDLGVIVFNGESDDVDCLLSHAIKINPHKKIVIIAGFMASRGVSFTDFSDADNKFELCIQVHYTKADDPLNSAAQAMRIFGPARRTITRPIMICNRICAEDLMYNFQEAYRIVKDLACGETEVMTKAYNSRRPLTQKYNFRYMVQSTRRGILLYETRNEDAHKLVI